MNQVNQHAIKNQIPSLNGIRAFSILLVILAHMADSYGVPAPLAQFLTRYVFGLLGVQIFFVLSGFLITHLLLKEKESSASGIQICKFYTRRALRILPVCYLYIFFIFIATRYLNIDLMLPHSLFIFGLTYTMNFNEAVIQPSNWLLGHLWSLSIEEQFYLFWPFAMKLKKNRMILFALLIIPLAMLSRFKPMTDASSALKFLAHFLKYADSLMIGALLAISWRYWPALWKRHFLKNGYLRTICLVACYLIYYYCAHVERPFFPGATVIGMSVVSCGIAYLIASAIVVQDDWIFKFLNHPVVEKVGILSYSLYIWQQFFLYPRDYFNGHAWWRVFPLNICLVFITAWISYYLWESLFLRVKENFESRKS